MHIGGGSMQNASKIRLQQFDRKGLVRPYVVVKAKRNIRQHKK